MWNIILDFDGRFWCTDVDQGSLHRDHPRGPRQRCCGPVSCSRLCRSVTSDDSAFPSPGSSAPLLFSREQPRSCTPSPPSVQVTSRSPTIAGIRRPSVVSAKVGSLSIGGSFLSQSAAPLAPVPPAAGGSGGYSR